MSIDLTGTPGGLFPRLGRLGRLAYLANQHQALLPAGFASLYAQFTVGQADPILSVLADDDRLTRGQSAVSASLGRVAGDIVRAAVRADAPAADRSLAAALAEVRRQMAAAGVTVKASTVGVTATPLASPAFVGSGQVVTSTKRGTGLVQELAVAETLRLGCVRDSYTGGAVAGREGFQLVGAENRAGVWDWDYPQGSGASAAPTSVSSDPGGGSVLAGGGFETWSQTPLQAENWAITTGTWATNAVQSSTALRGSYSCRLAAGATLTALRQQFGSTAATGATAGTAAVLTPLTSYAVHLWLRTASGTASAGVLTVELVDGSGTVVNDEQGVANSFAVTLSTLTTAWAPKSGVFRLPAVPPATVALRLRLSTALAGADVLLDDVCCAPLAAAYPAGPGLAVFAGATPFKAGDTWAVAVTNDRGGASYLATFQSLFYRLFGDPLSLLPSAGSPTLADTLITA